MLVELPEALGCRVLQEPPNLGGCCVDSVELTVEMNMGSIPRRFCRTPISGLGHHMLLEGSRFCPVRTGLTKRKGRRGKREVGWG
jgi:hypothetical protein